MTTSPIRDSLAAFVLALLAAHAASAKDTGIAYVSSEKDHAISLIDLKTLAVVGTIKTCKRPRHMQFLPGGTQLMVACGDSNKADIIDVATRKSLGSFAFGEDPEAFDLSPDAKTAYISLEDEGALGFFEGPAA